MRATTDQVIEKRAARKSRILLTGGSGFTGSFLAVELLKRGYHIIFLCRPSGMLSAVERMARVLDWHGYEGQNYEVISGRITDECLGLEDEQYKYLLETVDEIWHCAAETSFSERNRKQSEAINVGGTLNLLKLAEASHCFFFHFMSTAYVAGKRNGVCEEEHESQQQFFNVYEETKHRAELAAIEVCREAGIRLNIYRPSIIYGDSQRGRSLHFKALYVTAQTIYYLKDFFEKDLKENNGARAQELGVSREGDKLFMPGRVVGAEGSSFNLVPVDFVAAQSVAIMENSVEGDTFHIVCEEPNTLEEMLDFIQDYFKTAGLKVVDAAEFIKKPETPLEKLGYSFIDVYRPYICDTRVFENRKSAAIAEKCLISCPRLDYGLFSKCIDYAIKVNWGKESKPA